MEPYKEAKLFFHQHKEKLLLANATVQREPAPIICPGQEFASFFTKRNKTSPGVRGGGERESSEKEEKEPGGGAVLRRGRRGRSLLHTGCCSCACTTCRARCRVLHTRGPHQSRTCTLNLEVLFFTPSHIHHNCPQATQPIHGRATIQFRPSLTPGLRFSVAWLPVPLSSENLRKPWHHQASW